MTVTRDDIADRFIEAAETELRLPAAKVRPAGYGRSWVPYVFDMADMVGWGTERLAEERKMLPRRLPPSAAAIQRHEECLIWALEIVPEKTRRILWAWSFARAQGRSFVGWCRAKGVVPRTAYNRINRAFDDISEKIRREDGLMHRADELEGSQNPVDRGIEYVTGSDREVGADTWRADDAIPAWTLSDGREIRPVSARQALAEARRRALLGVG